MGFIKAKTDTGIKEEFKKYCIKHGINAENCIRPTPETAYEELYETFRERVKQKRFSYDAYKFSYYAGLELEKRALEICKLTWRPQGFKSFKVYHPERNINAPEYGDRVVERWYSDKYFIPYFKDRICPENMACQKGKGPHELLLALENTLRKIWKSHGTGFWFLQTDFEGYYDNLSHDWVKECFEGVDPYSYFLFCRTVDSWEEKPGGGKRYDENKEPGKKYGFPKGNLASQWAGIINMDGLDRELKSLPGHLGGFRYMDDSIHFFPDKKSAKACKEYIEEYLISHKTGIRLHPRKTKYAPITQGFNFCGWHYRLRDDGSVELKLCKGRKTLKKKQLKRMQKAYRKGRLSFDKIQCSMSGVFGHYHTGDTKNLRKYLVNRFRFKKDGEMAKHLRDLKNKTRVEIRREENERSFREQNDRDTPGNNPRENNSEKSF